MIIRRKVIEAFRILAFFVCTWTFAASANSEDIQLISPEIQNEKALDNGKNINASSPLENQINDIRKTMVLQEKKDTQRISDIKDFFVAKSHEMELNIKDIESSASSQALIIKNLRLELKHFSKQPNNEGRSFETWSGILLATSALILGAVGMGVALLSFIGYRDLIKKGTEKASIVAKEVAEGELGRLIESEKFDVIVRESMDRVMYRATALSSEFLTEDTEENGDD